MNAYEYPDLLMHWVTSIPVPGNIFWMTVLGSLFTVKVAIYILETIYICILSFIGWIVEK